MGDYGRDFLLKKVGLLFLALVLTFSPVTAFAETEESENEENVEEVENVEEENESTEESEEDAESGESSETDEVEESEEVDSTETEEDESTEEAGEEKEDAAEVEAAQENESAEEEETESSDEEKEEKNEFSTLQDEEESNCPLGKNMEGKANGHVELNDAGYYELIVTATIYNCYSTTDDEGAIGIQLPEGVELIDEFAPEGMEAREDRVYVPYPDIESDGEVTITENIPIMGAPTNENQMVMNEIDRYIIGTATDSYIWTDNIEESEVTLDFSGMTEIVSLPEAVDALEGEITGNVTGFDDYAYHLELNVDLTNHSDSILTAGDDIYAGFTIPEGLQVLENDEDVIGLNTDDNYDTIEEILVRVPVEQVISPGESVNQTVTVPVIGVVDENVTDSSLALYYGTDLGFESLGQLAGHANVDFSGMNEAWSFDAQSQLIKDFPDLLENQFGLQFAFNAQNLTIENADQVSVEFIVPDDIEVHEPESYTRGEIPPALADFFGNDSGLSEDLDITWNGNTATINLDTLEGSAGYNGYFSAIGESDLPIDELEGLKVVVTLYQDGEAVAKEISVPFEIVAYEGDGEEPTEEDPEEDPAEEPGESEDPSDEDGERDDDETNPEKDGSEGNNEGDGEGTTPNEEDPSNATDEEGQPSGDDDQGTTSDENQQQDHDGDDPVSKVNDTNTENTSNSTDEDSSSDEKDVSIGEKSEEDDESETTAVATDNNDHTLPATATNLYNILLAGFIFIVAGAATLFIRKRKMN